MKRGGKNMDTQKVVFMPRAFDEGAACYYSSRGTHPRWSNQVVAWSQLELVKYNVPSAIL